MKLLPDTVDVSFMRNEGAVECGNNDSPVSSQDDVVKVVRNLRSRAVIIQ